jgi:Transposase DDE domain
LLDHTVARARELGLLTGPLSDDNDDDNDDDDDDDDDTVERDKAKLAAADSTGLESRHTSTYFGKRSGRKAHRYPKLWAAVHAASHVCLSLACGSGPNPDDPKFEQLARELRGRVSVEEVKALAADVGFDGERHQAMLARLSFLGLIPPERGRPRTKSNKNQRSGFYRSFWKRVWKKVKRLYGQRRQVETFFSMLKRLLDSFLRATKRWSRHRELCLKVITLNLMITAHASSGL